MENITDPNAPFYSIFKSEEQLEIDRLLALIEDAAQAFDHIGYPLTASVVRLKARLKEENNE